MSPPLPADDLIARCRRVYAECETYADEGDDEDTLSSTDPRHARTPLRQDRRTFKTRWRRPGPLFFKVRLGNPGESDAAQLGAVWWSQTGTVTWTTEGPVSDPQAHGAPAVWLHVVMRRTALVVDLLLAAVNKNWSFRPSNRAAEVQQGVPCTPFDVDVTQRGRAEKQLLVWIGTDDALVRRIESDAFVDDSSSEYLNRQVRGIEARMLAEIPASAERDRMIEILRRSSPSRRAPTLGRREVTDFRPRLNVPLDDAEFEFTPPEVR
jgi:hypothetical protein